MTEEPIIRKEKIETIADNPFVKVFDLHYNEGRHYYDATRRSLDELVAIKSDEDYKKMLPDAVSCVVILNIKGVGPRLLLSYEYRYPAGGFLLGVPAGLMDPADKEKDAPVLETARREIREETGLVIKDSDKMQIVNPLLFSSPGLTDESNAIVSVHMDVDTLDGLTQEGAEQTECFKGFQLLSKEEARKILLSGRDAYQNFYSVYTWIALVYFISGIWDDQ